MIDPNIKYSKKALSAYIDDVENRLGKAMEEVKQLMREVQILTEELERERRPKMDER